MRFSSPRFFYTDARAAEKHAIYMRLRSMKLEGFENNEPAIALYEKRVTISRDVSPGLYSTRESILTAAL